MALNKYVTPHGGWKFIEGETIIEESDLDRLVLSLVAHRINNGKDMGNPTEDIEAQIEERKNNVNILRQS